MHRTTSWTALIVGAHLLIACGDDSGMTVSASVGDSEGATQDSAGTSSTTMAPTSGASATTGIGSLSDSVGETTTGTTGPDPTATTTPDPDTTASTGTTQGVDDTGESTAGESTAGESTAGESTSTSGESSTTDPSDTEDPQQNCPLVMQHAPCDADSDDPLHAFGLNCTSLGGDFVDKVNAVAITNLDFQAPDPQLGMMAWQVAKSYGSFVDPNTNMPFWGPREGEKLLLISSGLLPPANGQGAILVDDGDVFNDSFPDFNDGPPFDDNTMPPPMSPEHGSPDPMGFTNCDGTNDCSNTILDQWDFGFGNAEDKMWFGFELTAPAIANGDTVDANGYTFDFAYFSAEFPEYVDSQFNDIFVVWQDSEDYTGNVTFINGQPMTVTALWPIDYQGECDFNAPNCNGSADPHLADTGHQGYGGATGWYKATGGIHPGETFTLTFGIFDMGDSSFDTTALLDNWQWDCEGCVPSEVMSSGLDPQ